MCFSFLINFCWFYFSVIFFTQWFDFLSDYCIMLIMWFSNSWFVFSFLSFLVRGFLFIASINLFIFYLWIFALWSLLFDCLNLMFHGFDEKILFYFIG
jgi:hypothetical protein